MAEAVPQDPTSGPGADPGAAQVDAYLAGVGPPQRETLEALRATLRALLPEAQEGLRYGLPAFVVGGKGVAGYGAFRDHCGYYPMSGDVLAAAGDAVAGYARSKGALTFPVDEPLPEPLVRRLVELRLAELAAARARPRRGATPTAGP